MTGRDHNDQLAVQQERVWLKSEYVSLDQFIDTGGSGVLMSGGVAAGPDWW